MAAIDTNIGARTDGAVSKTNGHLIRVGPRAELRGVTVVSGGRHGIAVFPSSVSEQSTPSTTAARTWGSRCTREASPTASSPAIGITPASIWRAAARSIPGPTTSKPIPPSSRTASSTSMRGRMATTAWRTPRHGSGTVWSRISIWSSSRTSSRCSRPTSRRPRSWRSAVASARPTGAAAGRPV